MSNLRKSDAPRPRYRKVLEEVLPALEYAELQARMTFDPLIRDGHAGGKREHVRMKKLGIAGTPSYLTVTLQEAVAKVREALA